MFNNLVCSSERIDAPTIWGCFWGQGKRFSVKAIQPLSSQELTHKMLCRQSQLSAQPYRTAVMFVGTVFRIYGHIGVLGFRYWGLGRFA